MRSDRVERARCARTDARQVQRSLTKRAGEVSTHEQAQHTASSYEPHGSLCLRLLHGLHSRSSMQVRACRQMSEGVHCVHIAYAAAQRTHTHTCMYSHSIDRHSLTSLDSLCPHRNSSLSSCRGGPVLATASATAPTAAPAPSAMNRAMEAATDEKAWCMGRSQTHAAPALPEVSCTRIPVRNESVEFQCMVQSMQGALMRSGGPLRAFQLVCS